MLFDKRKLDPFGRPDKKKKSSKGQLETTELKISILSGYTIIS